MANDFSELVFDPITGTTKRRNPADSPYLNLNETNQGYLPYQPQYTQEAPDLSKGNAQVMATAQQTALQPSSSTGIQDQTTAMTQKLMTDPNMGRNWSKYNAGQMSKFDADRASSIKAYKEQNAGMGGAGQVQQGLVDLALQQNLDRGLLENELEQQAYDESMKNYLNAIAQGREQGNYLDTAGTNYLDNLINVRGAYEPQRAQEFGAGTEKELLGMQLKSAEDIANWEIASGEKLTAEKITSAEKIAGMEIASKEKIAADQNYLTQQGIDMDAATLYGYNDANGQHVYGQAELSGLKFGLESKDLQNQTVELFGGMVDTNNDGIPDKQVFGKYDLLSNEDKRAADELYGYDVKDAAGNVVGRMAGTLELQADRNAIEQQGLDLDRAKIMGYDKPDGTHVDGQLDIAMKQQGIELSRLGIDKDTAYGYVDETTGERVKGALEIQVEKLGIEKMLAALQEKQVDTSGIESTYNLINSEIEAGRAAPSDAMDYLNFVLNKNGVSLTEADKNAIFGEVAQDLKVQQYQFAITNPDMMVTDSKGNFTGLTEEGQRVFNNYVNSTFYGNGPAIGGKDSSGYTLSGNRVTDSNGSEISPSDLSVVFRNADDPTNSNNEKYQQMASQAETFSPSISDSQENLIKMGLGIGTGSVVNAGGRLMVITKGKSFSREGRNHNEFEIMDVATGTKKTFTGLTSTDNSVNNFDGWVAGLTG